MPGSTRSYEFCRRLSAAGHEVHVITTRRDDVRRQKKWDVTELSGVTIHWYPIPYDNAMGFFKRLSAFSSFAILSFFRLLSLRPDACFATSTPLTVAFPVIFARLFAFTPYIFEVRDLWPKVPIAMGIIRNPVLKFTAICLEWLAYRYSEHIIALSPDMAKGIKARCNKASDKVSVIPNSCDIELFSHIEVDSSSVSKSAWLPTNLRNSNFILYPGTLGKVNDITYIVELASELHQLQSRTPIVVVGDGAEKSKAINLSKQLGILDKQIFFFSAVEKSQMPNIFSLASVVLSTTLPIDALYANSANKFFDSLAAAKPICINYGGWQAKLICKHKIGVVLSRDTHDAAYNLLNFIKNPVLMKKASQNAHKLAESSFSRDKHFKSLNKIIIDSCRI